MPEVSVIMPCRNTIRYVGRALESVRDQTFPDWELLFVDDGSTDGSLEIARQAAKADKRIRLFSTKGAEGTAAARNVGVKVAESRYLAFLDSDDYWAPEKLEVQLRFMRETGAVISHTAYWTVNPAGHVLSLRGAKKSVTARDMMLNNWMGCLTVIVDLSKTEKRYFAGRRLNEDFVYWLTYLRTGLVAEGLNLPLGYYQVSPTSKSSNKVAVAKDRWRIYRDELGMSLSRAAYFWAWYAYFGVRKTRGLGG